MPGLEIRGLHKSFGDTLAVREFDLHVEDGELVVLVGPSGSGKTTVLRILAGLETADRGEVLIGGRDVSSLRPERRNVGMVFQHHALFPHRTVAANVGYGLRVRGHPRGEVRERVAGVARQLEIGSLLDRLPHELSGGERQRVALARALVRDPDLLLMDEPVSALDTQLRVQLRGEIARRQAQARTTTLYVTHDQAEALALGHRIAVLRAGRIEQFGVPQAVYDSPANAFVAGFLGSPSMNLLPRDGVILGVRPEHVRIGGSRWAGEQPADAGQATVERVEPAGDHSVLALTSPLGPLLARVEPELAPAAGTQLTFWFDRTHRFDRESGRAL